MNISEAFYKKITTEEGQLKPEYRKAFEEQQRREKWESLSARERRNPVNWIAYSPTAHRLKEKIAKSRAFQFWKRHFYEPAATYYKVSEEKTSGITKRAIPYAQKYAVKPIQAGLTFLETQKLKELERKKGRIPLYEKKKYVYVSPYAYKQPVKRLSKQQVKSAYESAKGFTEGMLTEPFRKPIKTGVMVATGYAIGGIAEPVAASIGYKTLIAGSRATPRFVARGIYATAKYGKYVIGTGLSGAYAISLKQRAAVGKTAYERGRIVGGAISTEAIPLAVGGYLSQKHPTYFTRKAYAQEQVFRAGLYGTKRELSIAAAQKRVVFDLYKGQLKQKRPYYDVIRGRYGKKSMQIIELLSKKKRGVFGSSEMATYMGKEPYEWKEPSSIKYAIKGKTIKVLGEPRIIKDVDLYTRWHDFSAERQFAKLGIKTDVKEYSQIKLHPFHLGETKIELGFGKKSYGLKSWELLARKFEGTWRVKKASEGFYRFRKDLQDFIRFASEPNWVRGKKILKPSQKDIRFLQVGWEKIPKETIWLGKPKPVYKVAEYPEIIHSPSSISSSSLLFLHPAVSSFPSSSLLFRSRPSSLSSSFKSSTLLSIFPSKSPSKPYHYSSPISAISPSIPASPSPYPYPSNKYSPPSKSPYSRHSYSLVSPSPYPSQISKATPVPPTPPFLFPRAKIKGSSFKSKPLKIKRAYAPSLIGISIGKTLKLSKLPKVSGIGIRFPAKIKIKGKAKWKKSRKAGFSPFKL